MAKTSVLNIRVEPETKKEIEELYSKFGITVSDAVNIFFHQSLMQGGLPFQMQVPSRQFNAETIEAMKEGEKIIKAGESRFENVDDMFKDLGI